jgi:hypothetical protein
MLRVGNIGFTVAPLSAAAAAVLPRLLLSE